MRRDAGQTVDFYLDYAAREDVATYVATAQVPGAFGVAAGNLLRLHPVFFSLSTNQEYYTFPAWPALLILIAAVVAGIEEKRAPQLTYEHQRHALHGVAYRRTSSVRSRRRSLAAVALGWCLWESRNLPFVADIGTLLAHRDVGDYTLSMSHFFDLTGPSFAALRLPAILAA